MDYYKFVSIFSYYDGRPQHVTTQDFSKAEAEEYIEWLDNICDSEVYRVHDHEHGHTERHHLGWINNTLYINEPVF